MKLNDKTYNVLKWVCLVVIPAVIALVAGIAPVLGMSDDAAAAVTTVLGAIATAIGGSLGFSTIQYNKELQEASQKPVRTHKVYLSPSEQANKYAFGETTEMVQCVKIAKACAAALEARGVTAVCEPDVAVTQRVRNATEAGDVDLYVPIHTNAFNGEVSGTRVFVRSFQDMEYAWAQTIFAYVDACCPGSSSNIKEYPGLYEFRKTESIPGVYVECDFHDVPDVAKFIISHTTEIGEAIAHGICDALGVEW